MRSTQRSLFDDCARGEHRELRELVATTGSQAVNVDRVCVACGVIVETISWTRDAWNARTRSGVPAA